MASPTELITTTNQKIAGAFTGVNIMTVLGWLIFIAVAVGGGWWIWVYYKNKKLFNKRITTFVKSGEQWKAYLRDSAKTIKLGKGGFEILFLKKLKTWKIAYGESIGINDYYFFVMPDGYWYNSVLFSDLSYLDKNKGLVQVGSTNPLMRGQYTALEKQIDSLHGQKQNWWDKYGNYVLSIAFIVIAGVMLWLMFKEYNSAVGQLSNIHVKLGEVLDKINNLASNVQTATTNSGLTQV